MYIYHALINALSYINYMFESCCKIITFAVQIL